MGHHSLGCLLQADVPGATALLLAFAHALASMKGAVAKNAALFNTHRMMRRYAAEAYLR